MNHTNFVNRSDELHFFHPKKQECRQNTLAITLLVIALLGGISAMGCGLGGLGAAQGWWVASALSHLGIAQSCVLIGVGGSIVLFSFIVLLLPKSKSEQNSAPTDNTINSPDETKDEQLKHWELVLQAWIDRAPSFEKEKRKEAAASFIERYKIEGEKFDLEYRRLQLGLQKWIDEAPHEKESRKTCADLIFVCFITKGILLNLSCRGITSLPKEIDQLPWLEHLDLCGTNFCDFPVAVCGLVHLRCLDMDVVHADNRISVLPAEIGRLTCLEHLSLRGHRLTLLPPEIGKLEHLKFLDLTDNQLTSLPLEISKLRQLKNIFLCGNRFTSFPLEICQLTALKNVSFSDNELTSFPPEIGQLNHLEFLDLDYNRIFSLPNAILELPPRANITIQNNSLSAHVIENLRQTVNAPGYSGPRIHFSMAREEIGEDRPLPELLGELCKAAQQPILELSHLCDNAGHSENLRNWLSRLAAIADYKTKRKELSLLIYQALSKAEQQADFRDVFWSCIDEAHVTCGDRMALSVLRLDIQFQIAESSAKGDMARLAYLIGHGTWALDELEKIAGNKARSLKFVDEVEVYLAYPIQLKKALQLPFLLDQMLYFRCSSVTEEDLKRAEEIVKGGLSNRQAYCDFLAKNDTWQKALEKALPKEYAAIVRKKNGASDEGNEAAIDRQFKQELAALTNQLFDKITCPPFIVTT